MKYKQQPQNAIDGIEHSVRTAETKKCRKLSTPLNFQRSPKKDITLNRHEIEGPRVGKKTRKMEEEIIFESKPKVWKVEMDEEDSDFECYDKSDGKPVHADIDKEVTEVKYQHSHYYRIRQKTKLTTTVR